MCAPSAPKTPAVQPIPDRQPMMLPDGGDPSLIANRGAANSGKLRMSSMIFAGKTGLGAPSIAAPLGTRGY